MTAAAPAADVAAGEAPPRRRAVLGWVAIVAGIVVVGFAMTMITGIAQLPARGLLDPDAAGPDGSRALARILEREGVDVLLVRDRDAAQAALAGGDATLAWGDTSPLSDETVSAMSARARDVVLLDPGARDLRVLLPGATTAGYGWDSVDPGCPLPEAQRAGAIEPGALFSPGPQFSSDSGATTCYRTDDGDGLLVLDSADGRISAIDATVLFTNQHLADGGNAALALNLLGRSARVVWYLPGLADSDFAATTPTLGELTPPWVTPALVLLLAAALAAAVWRGRRFGPLVAERLPVTVRAGETTAGRARLYARAGDPTHAADQLRIATLRRLARSLGLGQTAAASEISDAAAALLGADRAAVRALLIDETVADDGELVRIADRLRTLERQLHRRLRPERNSDDRRPDD